MLTLVSVPSEHHTFSDHPERPARVAAVLAALAVSPLRERLSRLEPVPATPEQVTRVHMPEYVAALKHAVTGPPHAIEPAPTYVTPQSFDSALLAVGGAIQAVEAALAPPAQPGEVSGAVALVRPPGHHCLPGAAMGFCLLNNVAIAARHAQARGAAKVMIVDIDLHHGNGTQAAFEDDPSVLCLSTHQAGLYPHESGQEREMGRGAGEGYTLNVPLPPGAGDQAYERVCEDLIRPAADRFGPDLLLVSAGYDAHWRDPLGNLQLSARGYGHMVQALRNIALHHCGGRIALVLEGGYDLRALPACVLASLGALLGDEALPDPVGPAGHAEPDVRPLISRLRSRHGLG
jgi:acetoin utilization deacetylase AcuC-like enzyme